MVQNLKDSAPILTKALDQAFKQDIFLVMVVVHMPEHPNGQIGIHGQDETNTAWDYDIADNFWVFVEDGFRGGTA